MVPWLQYASGRLTSIGQVSPLKPFLLLTACLIVFAGVDSRDNRTVSLLARIRRLCRAMDQVHGLVKLANEDVKVYNDLQPDLDLLVKNMNLLYESLVLEAEILLMRPSTGPTAVTGLLTDLEE